jgi:MFS family permease
VTVDDTRPHSERLITPAFAAVTMAAFVFFVYIGVLIVVIPRFVERELRGGEFGVGLTLAVFAGAAILARPMLGWFGDRFGRRRLMMTGAVLAAVSGAASGLATTLWMLLAMRALTGVGEAAMFVGAATMIADLSPPHRRAEAASYFSVSVFGGIGLGPVLGERILGEDRYVMTFAIAGAIALISALCVAAIPRRVDRRAAATTVRMPRRFIHPAALWPGLVLGSGIAGFAVFSAFLPEYSRSIGLSGAGGLFFVYSLVCLTLRVLGARLPERLGAGRSVTIALVTMAASLVLIASVPLAWGLWTAAVTVGIAMAFLYPSLMALVVDLVHEDQRARAISSFTMFFEVGTVVGGLLLGGIGQLLGKRAGFAGGSVICLLGLVVLWTKVVERRGQPASALPAYAPVVGE